MNSISRRQFLKEAGLILGGLAIAPIVLSADVESKPRGKPIQGYINSVGRGVIYYQSPSYYLLDKKPIRMDTPPSTSSSTKSRLPMVDDMIAGLRDGNLVVSHYNKGRKSYDIIREDVIAPASVDPRVSSMKKLKDGTILLAWYKEIVGFKSYPCFSFYDGEWNTMEAEWTNYSGGAPWMSADFAEMDVIYYFGHSDSDNNICCIKLTKDGIISIDYGFTTKYSGDLSCEGENPFIVCDEAEDGIILAYQNHNYKFFQPSYFYKGAKISVTKVNPNSHTLIYQTEDYAERATPFALIGESLIFAPVTGIEWEQRNKFYYVQDGAKTLIGEAKYPSFFRQTEDKFYYNGADYIKSWTIN